LLKRATEWGKGMGESSFGDGLLVDSDRPVNAEFVHEPACGRSRAPGLLGQGHLDHAAFGQAVEDLVEAVFVRATQGQGHVFADPKRCHIRWVWFVTIMTERDKGM